MSTSSPEVKAQARNERFLLTACLLLSVALVMTLSSGCRALDLSSSETNRLGLVQNINDDLFKAAGRGDVALVKSLLEAGADVNAKEEEGETPLMYAAVEGRTQVILLLVKHGASLNALSNNNETALARAALRGQSKSVEILIENGANVELGGPARGTPLMYAASAGDLKTVNILLAKRANVNATDVDGDTALTYAILNKAAPSITIALIRAGANVNSKNRRGDNPLVLATRHRQTKTAQILRRAGAK